MNRNMVKCWSCIICILSFFTCMHSAQAAIEANAVFSYGEVCLYDAFSAELFASTKGPCEEIVVSSMYLQRVNSSGSTIYFSTRISGPSESFSDSSNYWGAHDFSGSATTGNYYRIKVTFSAEGESITRYSNIVYYD